MRRSHASQPADRRRVRLAQNRKPFTLVLRAFEAEPCKADAHLFGHHASLYSKDAPNEAQRPCLYIEFEE